LLATRLEAGKQSRARQGLGRRTTWLVTVKNRIKDVRDYVAGKGDGRVEAAVMLGENLGEGVSL